MKLDAVMDEAARALTGITGLRVSAWPAQSISPPAGYVSYPQSVQFDETYGRGSDQFTDLPIVLLAGPVNAKPSRDLAARWAAGSGPMSIKALLEQWRWASCDDLTVTSAEFEGETIGGVVFLAVNFKATVVGPGEG